MTSNSEELQKQLSDLFGSYRAEWLQEKVFDLYTEPRYFPELTTRQSCVLVGGRGTGKTTVLRGLSYLGQYALSQKVDASARQEPQFIGLYHRINTNHVAAFTGAGWSAEQWIPAFAHYTNLLLCELLLEFVDWYENTYELKVDLDRNLLTRVCTSLHLAAMDSHRELHDRIIDSRLIFEAEINNIADHPKIELSLQQRPVELLCNAVLACQQFRGKHIFFLLDEYENLLPYQQQVLNTYIKHTTGQFFFKIGVKELGWVCRTTLQPNEQLVSPADYALVRIGDKMNGESFLSFATEVCETRLRQVKIEGKQIDSRLRHALPSLSIEEEADLLGVAEHASSILQAAESQLSASSLATLEKLSNLEIFFLSEWSKSHSRNLQDEVTELESNPASWRQRFDNYKYAALFAIRKRKRGVDKYYCGLDVYAQLACGNIRYMLELVDHSLMAHIRSGSDLLSPISPEVQTKTAQSVGAMNLSELEGLSVSGAKLTKLLLALGRIFQQFAAEPFGHAPELNQFHLTSMTAELDDLLKQAVMHLALVRFQGTKLVTESDTIEFDYTIHPIFAALFEFSPRRKRKMEISSSALLALIESPKQTISGILREHKRATSSELPRQLTFFSQFYGNDG
ncbi:MAG: hypothetical protein NTV29_04390 [Planctomycetota bacterium]|jgi:hypothetical protein|nr:hypothetical protein [Planctomycetota bacterium]